MLPPNDAVQHDVNRESESREKYQEIDDSCDHVLCTEVTTEPGDRSRPCLLCRCEVGPVLAALLPKESMSCTLVYMRLIRSSERFQR